MSIKRSYGTVKGVLLRRACIAVKTIVPVYLAATLCMEEVESTMESLDGTQNLLEMDMLLHIG